MSTNDTVIKALARLEGNQDFEVVLEHMRKLHADAVEAGSRATELVYIGREQGKQHVLKDVLNLARDARSVLAKRG